MFLLRATSICKLLCPYSRLAKQQQQLWVTATSNSQPYSSTRSSDLNVNEQFVPGLDHIIPPHHLKRKGFGGKIVLPASVLHSAVVSSETPVELTLRAYHVGSRVHIGQVLNRLAVLLPADCKTTSGRDYLIIWGSDEQKQPQQQRTSSTSGFSYLEQVIPTSLLLDRKRLVPYVNDMLANMSAGLRARLLRPYFATQDEAAAAAQLYDVQHIVPPPKQQQQQQQPEGLPQPPTQQQQQQQHVEPSGQSMPAQQDVRADTMSQPMQPPLIAIYRSGSVVFAGLAEKTELLWLSHLVPPSVRYVPPSRHYTERSDPSVLAAVDVWPKEVQKVVVDASCPEQAVLGRDEVRLRKLDVGGVHVLTSVLAQSAALRYYEESVQQSLERLADWRVAQSSTPHTRARRVFSSVLSQPHEKVLFKVIAASVLVVNEAQQLLEMAEPAWQYDQYNKIYEVMEQDYQLQSRLKALELKLHQAETEAKHDVKAKAGRRMRKLETGLVWLLVVSCLLVALEVGRKVSLLKVSDSSSTAADIDEREGDGDAAVAQ